MAEEVDIRKATEEIKNASEEDLKKLVESWYERTRTAGLKIGAKMISAAVFGEMKKHLKKGKDSSLRDYQRCMDGIFTIISVQLAQQTDSEEVSDSQEDEV